MNKIAIFTDLHLGVHQNSSFWINISIDWVKWFRDDLKKRDITQIIFCGDFFHFRDEVSLVSLDAAYKVLDILKDFKMYMITGNHDCYYKHSSEVNSLSIIKGRSNVEVYDEMTVLNIPGIKNKFVLCPWGTKLDDIPAADVVFGHFELENFNMNAHKICEHGDDVDKLVLKSPLIFSGHFHLRDEKRIHNSRVIYVGNPFQMDFGDAHQRKGYYILDADTLDYEFVENDTTPKHIKIYLSKLITSTNVDELFSELLPNNIIKLVIDKNISSDHLDVLTTKMTSYKPNELRMDYDVNYNKLKLNNDSGIDLSGVDITKAIEEFVDLLDINNKKEVVDYTVNLYNRSKL